jgi:hypothetical protein
LGTVQFVLSRLNYASKSLSGFPACAFDRPIGEKLLDYGHAFPAGILISGIPTRVLAAIFGNRDSVEQSP